MQKEKSLKEYRMQAESPLDRVIREYYDKQQELDKLKQLIVQRITKGETSNEFVCVPDRMIVDEVLANLIIEEKNLDVARNKPRIKWDKYNRGKIEALFKAKGLTLPMKIGGGFFKRRSEK